MIGTAAAARAEIVDALDSYIVDRVDELERRIRRDLLATGPEDDRALELPADPDGDWSRVSIEEVLLMERSRLEDWRENLLALFDRIH